MMREQSWNPSRKSQESPVYVEIIERLANAVENDRIDGIDTYYYEKEFEDSDEALDDITSELHKAEALQLTPSEIQSISRLLSLEKSEWGYGQTRANGQLFDFVSPVLRRPTDSLATAALAGVLGLDIVGKDKKIDTLTKRLARTPHEQRVLIGTAALIVESNRRHRWEDYPGFDNTHTSGIASRIETYADFHGDFRMREIFQADTIVDPLGREQLGGPAIEAVYVAGYHSVEPYLLMNVLFHQSKHMDTAELRQFADRVVRRIYDDKTLEVKVGPYGDWGTDSGGYEADLLRNLIEEGDASSISHLTVLPQGRERLTVGSMPEGMTFRNMTADNEGPAITISNDKIEDFIVTLITSAHGHGRTAPGALLTILDTVRDHDSQIL